MLASVGPWSVVRYLEFAIGRGIGSSDEDDENEISLQKPAVGMERVARTYDPDSFDGESLRTVDNSTIGPSRASSLRSTRGRVPSLEFDEIKKESCAAAGNDEGHPEEGASSGPRYFYGFAGEKIGQACVSWLCRWGVDILPIEEEMAHGGDVSAVAEVTGDRGKRQELSLTGRMRGISLSDVGSKKSPTGHTHSASWTPTTTPTTRSSSRSALRIWARGGLPAEWVRIVISSDAFWVRNEMERYEFAKRVVALRLGDADAVGEEEEREEEELAMIFEKGIYYSHMVGLALSSVVIIADLCRLSSNFRSSLPTSTPLPVNHTYPSACFNPPSGRRRITKARSRRTDKTEHPASRGNQMCRRMESRSRQPRFVNLLLRFRVWVEKAG